MSASPAFAKYPNHKIAITQHQGMVEIWFKGIKVASTVRALEMCEADYAPVFYLPFADCHHEYFNKTSHTTFCPFKGTASYWSLETRSGHTENAVWSYENPYDQVAEIIDHVAFYSDKVEVCSI